MAPPPPPLLASPLGEGIALTDGRGGEERGREIEVVGSRFVRPPARKRASGGPRIERGEKGSREEGRMKRCDVGSLAKKAFGKCILQEKSSKQTRTYFLLQKK